MGLLACPHTSTSLLRWTWSRHERWAAAATCCPAVPVETQKISVAPRSRCLAAVANAPGPAAQRAASTDYQVRKDQARASQPHPNSSAQTAGSRARRRTRGAPASTGRRRAAGHAAVGCRPQAHVDTNTAGAATPACVRGENRPQERWETSGSRGARRSDPCSTSCDAATTRLGTPSRAEQPEGADRVFAEQRRGRQAAGAHLSEGLGRQELTPCRRQGCRRPQPDMAQHCVPPR